MKPGYSRLEDDKYIYHARVHGNWHAGGYVYFATIEEKTPPKVCGECKRPHPAKLKKVFDGRWDSYNDTVTLTATDGDWSERIAYVVIPKD